VERLHLRSTCGLGPWMPSKRLNCDMPRRFGAAASAPRAPIMHQGKPHGRPAPSRSAQAHLRRVCGGVCCVVAHVHEHRHHVAVVSVDAVTPQLPRLDLFVVARAVVRWDDHLAKCVCVCVCV
jgi:hypothetical protein